MKLKMIFIQIFIAAKKSECALKHPLHDLRFRFIKVGVDFHFHIYPQVKKLFQIAINDQKAIVCFMAKERHFFFFFDMSRV